jgi:pimeloyl-ACP methyl ester carboxylesterase
MTEPDAAPLARFQSPDVEIAYAEAGPADGELVILLHGFPEFWRGWRNQIAGLAAAGFRVVVPDQRGYGSSGKPAGISSYDLDVLAEDVAALARHLGHERFAVVGHDWGASVAWWLATRHPERLSRLVVLNAPHPSVWREAMDGNWRQWLKSLYVRILRLPRLPEAMVRARNFKALADALAPAGLPAEELARYRAAWAEPGALTGMINWYRAFLAKRLPPAASLDIAVPTLVIWGDRDPFALPALAETSAALCRDARVVHIPEATHWVHHEQAERVGALLLDFLGASKGG